MPAHTSCIMERIMLLSGAEDQTIGQSLKYRKKEFTGLQVYEFTSWKTVPEFTGSQVHELSFRVGML